LLSVQDGDNLVLHSDQAAAYHSCTPAGVVEQWSVNHSEGEYAYSISALKDVETRERRAGAAGTMSIDRSWRWVKQLLPRGGISCKTVTGRRRMMLAVRANQWKHLLSTHDRWPSFCQAANRFREEGAPSSSDAAPTSEPKHEEEVLQGDGFEKEGLEDDDSEAPLFLASQQAWGDRYFEPQSGARCGQHALNNLFGGPQFDDAGLDGAFQEVMQELPHEQEAEHRQGAGWYSHSVLATVLQQTVPPTWRLVTSRVRVDDWQALTEDDAICGVLLNIANRHWTCICKDKAMLFYVDSKFLPVLLDQADWQSILNLHPNAFLVAKHDSTY
jgi:hypothetical protein